MRQLFAVPFLAATLALAACSGSTAEESAASANATEGVNDISATDGGLALDNATFNAGNAADAGAAGLNGLDAATNASGNAGETATNAL
jgi:hypothetical protein